MPIVSLTQRNANTSYTTVGPNTNADHTDNQTQNDYESVDAGQMKHRT